MKVLAGGGCTPPLSFSIASSSPLPSPAQRRSARPARKAAGLTVLAASSLTNVFPKIDSANKYSFGGSDALAAQIQQGAPADVFAAASPEVPGAAVPEGSRAQARRVRDQQAGRDHADVEPCRDQEGLRPVQVGRRRSIIGDKAVPIGSYTRQMLTNLGLQCVLSNVVSNEQNVRDILTKISLGEADAGFVYITDAKTVPGKVKTFFLPGWAQPHVKYEIAVLKSSSNQAAARRVHQEGAARSRGRSSSRQPASADRRGRSRSSVTRNRRLFSFGLFLATGIAALFLLLPLLAIFLRVPPGKLIRQLGDPVVRDALLVTPEDERDRDGADPPARHADGVPDRHAPLPGPRARRHARRAAARPAARRRGHRAAGRVRPRRAARDADRLARAFRSRSRRSPS